MIVDQRDFAIAVAWQLLPVAWCVLTFRQLSMLPGMMVLLLLVVPCAAGIVHRSIRIALAAFAIPAVVAIGYAALAVAVTSAPR